MTSFGAGDDALSQSHPKSMTVGIHSFQFGWCFKISTICVKTGPGLVFSLEVDENVGESTIGAGVEVLWFFVTSDPFG